MTLPSEEHTTTVVIVGSGAGGATVAEFLAERGFAVTVLEMGRYHKPKEFTQREDACMATLFQRAGGTGNRDLSVVVMMGQGVGGSTVHNGCLCYRPPDAILARWAREYGVRDLTPASLEPYLRRVERNIGVGRVPEHMVNANNDVLRQGTLKLGWKGHIPFHNRIECVGCGYCTLGCAYNRKQSMLITTIPKAESRGAKIMARVKIDTILRKDGRAVGVEGTRYAESGEAEARLRVNAPRVVVSAGGVQSAVLLLRNGISTEVVGRTLHIHPAMPVGALFDRPIDAYRGTPQTWVSDEFARFYEDGYGGHLIMAQSATPGLTASLIPGVGEKLGAMMKQYNHIAAATGMIHDETNGVISVEGDRWFIDYWPDERDRRELVEGAKRCAEIFLAAGAREVFLPCAEPVSIASVSEIGAFDAMPFEPHRVQIAAVHPQSSVPMGEDRTRCAVDSFGRSHEVAGLYVADMSVFPTSVGVPPQITTQALAARTADRIAASLAEA